MNSLLLVHDPYICKKYNVLNTSQQYDSVIQRARDVFFKKVKDYGTSWRILRTTSLTDQIYIKASRIRSIEVSGVNKVNEPIDLEFVGIINYGIMALIQLKLKPAEEPHMDIDALTQMYNEELEGTKELMMTKNHDYGEAWREMRISSMTDLILMKLLRTKQIEDNNGKTIISEGLDANYSDIINYAVFALIKLQELEEAK